jgi:hypothetical protein
VLAVVVAVLAQQEPMLLLVDLQVMAAMALIIIHRGVLPQVLVKTFQILFGTAVVVLVVGILEQ